jgi:hypothetical protein
MSSTAEDNRPDQPSLSPASAAPLDDPVAEGDRAQNAREYLQERRTAKISPSSPASDGSRETGISRMQDAAKAALAATMERAAATRKDLSAKLRQGARAAGTRAMEQTIPGLRSQTTSAARASWRFTRGTAAPWLALKAKRMRQRLRPAMLARDYRATLLALHENVTGRDVESLLFAPTREQRLPGNGRTGVVERLAAEGRGTTPARDFNWAMRALPEPVERFVFMQVGAGRGRDLLLASALPFERIVGIEPDAGLHNDCTMNIAQYPRSRMKCRDVECLHRDVAHFPIPEQETVFYLFKPDPVVLAEVAQRIAAAYQRHSYRIYVLGIGLPSSASLRDTGIFERLPLEPRLRLKIAALSPYRIALFRSIA